MILHKATNRATASQQASERIANAIQAKLTTAARATLIASGGTSPIDCYRSLAQFDLPWDRVDVIPSDERYVALDDNQRNTKMLRQNLKQSLATSCVIHEIDAYDHLPTPAAITLLGMGEDGHFASIFPDIPELAQTVDLSSCRTIYEVRTRASSVPRTTLSLSALCNSQLILLLVFGDKKLNLIDRPDGLPIEHLFNQSTTPVEVIWSS